MSNNFIDIFLEYQISVKNIAKNTANSYKRDMLDLLEFCENKKLGLLEVSRNQIREYISKLYDTKLSNATIVRKFYAMKQFFNFLILENHRKDNPMKDINLSKNEEKLPKFLTIDEINHLLEHAKTGEDLRFYTMLEVLYSTGMRVSELVSITYDNIQTRIDENGNIQHENYLLIKGKGSKERIVPISDRAISALKEYLIHREISLKQQNRKSKWIFYGDLHRGKERNKNLTSNIYHEQIAIKDNHITRQRFHQLIAKLGLVAINKQVSPHAIRHSFATHLLNNGMDIRILQEILGHSDISTTQIYTHLAKDKLQEILFKYHPLANI